MKREKTDLIVVHCSATPASMTVNVAVIDGWHKARGWQGIGYHKVILRDGVVEQGRATGDQGAHVKGYNATSVGVCLVGGIDERSEGIYNFTKAQMASLRVVVSGLRRDYPGARIVGHRDLDPGKACPCFDVAAWAEEELF